MSDGDVLLPVEDLPYVGPAAAALNVRDARIVSQLAGEWQGPGFEPEAGVFLPVVHRGPDHVLVIICMQESGEKGKELSNLNVI